MSGRKSSLPKELAEKAKREQEIKPFRVEVAVKDTGRKIHISPRAMTRGELKALREAGLDPTYWQEKRVAVKLRDMRVDLSKELSEEEQLKMLSAISEAAGEADALGVKNADFIDWILEHVYAAYSFDDVPNPQCMLLATMTYQMTMTPGAGEVKN